jgi:hypothetical protein
MELKSFRLLSFITASTLEWHLMSAAILFLLRLDWCYGLVFATLAVVLLALAVSLMDRTDNKRFQFQGPSTVKQVRLCLVLYLAFDVALLVVLLSSAIYLGRIPGRPFWTLETVVVGIPLGGILILLGGLAMSLRLSTSKAP